MLSVVIPTLNEAHRLPHTLAATRAAAGDAPIQLIVADCDSPDGSAAIARRAGADRVLTGASSRATALNLGAAHAAGQSLLFLHADSLPPPHFPHAIAHALADPHIVGGAFEFDLTPPPARAPLCALQLRLVVLVNRARYRWTRNFYGDQGIFIRRSAFARLGGFPNLPLLEDVRFCQRMKRLGRTAILRPPILTSSRRFLRKGVARQFATDLLLLSHDALGLPPTRLHATYNHLNTAPH